MLFCSIQFQKMKNTLILFLSSLFLGCTSEAQTYPDKNWSRVQDPLEVGWGYTGRSKIVLEYGDIEENSYIASCRKSVLAMLYGKHVDDGTINLNKTLGELDINDVSPLLPIEKKATIKDLISARHI